MLDHANNRHLYGRPLAVHLLNASPAQRISTALRDCTLFCAGAAIAVVTFLYFT